MITDTQLEEIKNNITNIEIEYYESYNTKFGITKSYKNKEHHHIFNNVHLVLDIDFEEYYSNLFCYNGITEVDLTNSENEIKIVNISISDTEYKFTEQQENEIINAIEEITFKS